MTKHSIARKTLAQARFFVEQAELSGVADRKAFEAYLEAAIVLGRSVTFHIQKEYGDKLGFKSWYSTLQTTMKADPVFSFFRDRRNFILKQGPAGIYRVVSLSAQAAAVASVGTLEVRVIRAKPWYRRGLKILWEDFRAAVVRPIHKWRQRRELARRRARAQSVEVTDDNFYFDEPAWRDRPAVELLREYLDKLGTIVDEVETRFQGGC